MCWGVAIIGKARRYVSSLSYKQVQFNSPDATALRRGIFKNLLLVLCSRKRENSTAQGRGIW